MIFGEYINFNKLKNKPKEVIENFLNSNFKKPEEIPYYQNCKNITLNDVVNKIVVNS